MSNESKNRESCDTEITTDPSGTESDGTTLDGAGAEQDVQLVCYGEPTTTGSDPVPGTSLK